MNDTSTPVRTHNQFPLDRIVRHGSVLRTLLAASGRSMTVRELAGRAGTPYATTWRLVQDLLAARPDQEGVAAQAAAEGPPAVDQAVAPRHLDQLFDRPV